MNKILPILFFSLVFLLFGHSTYAQTYGIVKTQAFFRKSTAGNIQVDNNGNPTSNGVNKDYLIYVETKGNTLPQWSMAYINGLPYTMRAVEVKNPVVNLGQLKAEKTRVKLTKASGNRLWQMVLTPQQANEAQTVSNSIKESINLAGTFKGKKFTYKIVKIQELAKQFNP